MRELWCVLKIYCVVLLGVGQLGDRLRFGGVLCAVGLATDIEGCLGDSQRLWCSVG